MLTRLLAGLMGLAARRPALVVASVLVLAAAGAGLALRLEPKADTDTLIGSSTPGYAATERLHSRFGDDAVYVVVREPVTQVVLTRDIVQVLGLEGCLAGNVPAGVRPPGGPRGPCGRLAATKPAKVVFGPGTFLNEAVGQITNQFTAASASQRRQADKAARAAYQLALRRGSSESAARAYAAKARDVVTAGFYRDVMQLALRYGITSAPSLSDPRFVARLVFDERQETGTPKARFASIFPGREGALIQVRLRDGLSDAQRARAISDIRAAAAMPQWRLSEGDYAVTGAPVVVDELSRSISRSTVVLLGGAVLVMALTLLLVFRARRRLLPLLVALCATAIAFGAMSVVGAPLTMASIAVIPILIGLAVDYAIQLQSRVQEQDAPLPDAVARVAADGAPTIVVAACATAAGFLVLGFSPVPMVRGFGLLLVAGIAIALLCALTLGIAAQALAAQGGRGNGRARAAVAPIGAAWRGAGEIVRGSPPARLTVGAVRHAGRRALGLAVARPGRLLAVAALLAACGWALETRTRVESDVQKLVPQRMTALEDLRELQRISGVGGEVGVLVEGRRVTDPAVVAWMTRYQARILKRLRFDARRGCGRSELCPAFSLPDLFTTSESLSSRRRVEGLLDAVPPYFSQSVISPDRRAATLSFGIKLLPLERQYEVLETMRRELDPPPGVSARLAGLPVLAAEANERLASPWRRLATLLGGLLAVALVLLAALRNARRALVPLVPIALATGWSALVIFLLRVPLNPLSLMLSALVVAIATEFSVLLAERFRAERASGLGVTDALAATYRSTGAAVLASGLTATAGFGVLVFSDIKMLRDFGAVTAIDLGVALLGVLIVLPAVLVLAERGATAPGRALTRRRRTRAQAQAT